MFAARPLQLLPLTGALAVLAAVPFHRRSPDRLGAGRLGAGRVGAGRPDVAGAARTGGAVAVALLLVASAGALVYRPPAPAATDLVPVSAVGTYDADDANLTWLYGGGFDRLTAVTARRAAVVRAGPARAAVTAACRQLRTELRRDARFPLPPADPVRSDWSALLGGGTAASEECVRDSPAPGGATPALTPRFRSADERVTSLLNEVLRLADRVGRR